MEEEEEAKETTNLKKFKKIGNTIKLVAQLSTKIIPEAEFDREQEGPVRSSAMKVRRAALAMHRL